MITPHLFVFIHDALLLLLCASPSNLQGERGVAVIEKCHYCCLDAYLSPTDYDRGGGEFVLEYEREGEDKGMPPSTSAKLDDLTLSSLEQWMEAVTWLKMFPQSGDSQVSMWTFWSLYLLHCHCCEHSGCCYYLSLLLLLLLSLDFCIEVVQ